VVTGAENEAQEHRHEWSEENLNGR